MFHEYRESVGFARRLSILYGSTDDLSKTKMIILILVRSKSTMIYSHILYREI